MNRNRNERVRTLVLALACWVLADFGVWADASQVWVVGQLSRDITIIDVATESIVNTIPLNGAQDEPWGIAFSTVPGQQADFAFVTQGTSLRVIDTTTRQIVQTYAAQDLFGEDFVMRGIAAALPEAFGATPVTRSLVHVAMTRSCCGMNAHYAVLDQEGLISGQQGAQVVSSGSLESSASSGWSVHVMQPPFGNLRQRSLYSSVRADGMGNTTLTTHRVSTDPLLSAWTVESDILQDTLPAGQMAPRGFGSATPFCRELNVGTRGALGKVVNLDTGDFCEVSGANFGAVAVNGPGPNAYEVLALDPDDNKVWRIDPQDCSASSFNVGTTPTAIAHVDLIDGQAAFIANNADNSVSVLRDDDTIGTILNVGAAPQSLAAKFDVGNCRITNVQVSVTISGDNQIDWTATDCPPATTYQVWCTCDPPGCPADCLPGSLSGGVDVGSPLITLVGEGPIPEGSWIPLGSGSCCGFTHPSAGTSSTFYMVTPE